MIIRVYEESKNTLPQCGAITPMFFNLFKNDQLTPRNMKFFLHADDQAIVAQYTTFDIIQIH